jgi:20S proteasome subunit beta 4
MDLSTTVPTKQQQQQQPENNEAKSMMMTTRTTRTTATRTMCCDLRRPFAVFFVVLLASIQRPAVVVEASKAAGTETLVGIVGRDFVLLMTDSSVSQGLALQASNLDKIAALSDPFPEGRRRKESTDRQRPSLLQAGRAQQTAIVAAAAGDAADSDRLLGYLKAYATMEEYQNGWGCDVRVVPAQSRLEDRYNSRLVEEAPGFDVEAMAHFARRTVADNLRTAAPFRVCMLIAGMMKVKRKRVDNDFVARVEGLQGDDAVPVPSTTSPNFLSQMVQRQVQQVSDEAKGDASLAVASPTVPTSSSSSASYQPRLFWLDEYGSLQQIQYGAHGYGSNLLLSILDRGYRPDMTLEDATALMKECFQELRSRYAMNSPQPPCIKCVDEDGIRRIPVVNLDQ